MGFQEAVATCFKKYFHIRGRAQRSEFWWWILFTTVASIILSIVDLIAFNGYLQELSPTSSLFSLLTFIPSITVTARRLHDIDKSGWWQLLPLAPIVLMMVGVGMMIGSGATTLGGASLALVLIGLLATLGTVILLIVWWATDGHKNDNRFGPSPKYGGQALAFD